MKLIIDIPNYNFNEVQNGSIASNEILKAVRNGIPYEPKNDLISREALKKAFENLASDDYNEPIWYQKTVFETIDNAPTMKNSSWIPVTERLPANAFVGCIVTVLDTDRRTGDDFENILPYFVGFDGETWNDGDGDVIPFEVLAWMPLPEPYTKEDADT